MAYFKCGDGYTAEYVIHVVIIVIFQVWLWRVGFDLIQTKIDKSYKSQNSNQFLYKEDDGYICQIKKSIRNLILSFVINTCVFYSMMAIWNEVFSDYYICVEETVFYPITDAAQIFTIIKGFSILAYSGIINWFFYASRHIHFKYKPGSFFLIKKKVLILSSFQLLIRMIWQLTHQNILMNQIIAM